MHSSRPNRKRKAFTLVELLVVIGIIAVLIAMLLPALNKAREGARAVQCLSNMKQLATATIMFANEHKGYMPGNGAGLTVSDPSTGQITGSASPATDYKTPADWIAWQRKTDPITGMAYSAAMDQNITFSALTPYLGGKYIDHTIGNHNANDVAAKLESVYRCPSDNLQSRPKTTDFDGGKGLYRYSYAMNYLVANPVKGIGTSPVDSKGYAAGARNGWMFSGKISSIKKSSNVILLICEDEQTIDDGYFNPNPSQWTSAQCEMLASRHSIGRASANNNTSSTGNQDARGNVAFCDGHGEMLGRKDALRARYTGRPDPDPTNF
jgi:prepilin-type N-terminal cleavage/methylation domain-containing protein/prepilin-type processing-associated H-X9-DG protein